MEVSANPVLKNERIIPITILDGPHQLRKTLNQVPLTPPQSPPPSALSDSNSRRQSLLVTLDDGTTTEIQGIVTNLSNNNNNNNNNTSSKLTIQEIGQETLEREMSKEKQQKVNLSEKNIPTKNVETVKVQIERPREEHSIKVDSILSSQKINLKEEIKTVPTSKDTMPKSVPKFAENAKAKFVENPKVRHVPIRLDDGKVIQREPDEKVEIRSEFSNYSHEEILDRTRKMAPNSSSDSTIKDSAQSAKLPTQDSAPAAQAAKERIIPIRLESGENIMPVFTQLEDPEPPKWSTFSKGKQENGKDVPAKEKIVPLQVEPETSADERGRKRTKDSESATPEGVASSTEEPGPRRTSRSTDRKQHTVRFNVNEEKTERRSESRESYTRRSSNRNIGKSKPPAGPSDRHSFTSGVPAQIRKPGSSISGVTRSESPSSRRESTPDTNQKTLLDIDRDITRIWKELQDLDTSKPPPKFPLTPVKVKSYTIPTVTHAERVSRASCTPPPPPLSSSLPSSSGQRTIWDSDGVGSWTPPPASAAATTETSFVPHRDHIEPTRPGSILPANRRGSSSSRGVPYQPKTSISPPVSTVTGTHLANQKSSSPLPINGSTNQKASTPLPINISQKYSTPPVNAGLKYAQPNNNNNNNNKNPFMDESFNAPLADSESTVSPGSPTKSLIRGPSPNYRHKNTATDDDGLYEGVECQTVTAPKLRKSESPTKSDKSNPDNRLTDKATQTGMEDEEEDKKKQKKSGNCVIL